jgi:hypothetical protein
MSISKKYGRTYHYDFSPGTTSDDRINWEWREDVQKIDKVMHSEKMDGENTCLNGIGVFARSHAAPTRHSWADHLRQKHAMIRKDLEENELDIFGENLYAIHSIIYPKIESHFYVFGVRCKDKWLSWEESKWYADFFEYPMVPILGTQDTVDPELIKQYVEEECIKPSVFDSFQNNTDPLLPCRKEGLVTRNVGEFSVDEFKENVFKYVRKDHVQTDEHWSSRIVRANLKHENEAMKKKK